MQKAYTSHLTDSNQESEYISWEICFALEHGPVATFLYFYISSSFLRIN